MAPERRTTLNDLAAGLRLSANTVSRALAGKDGVSERTRLLVLEEAHRTGYLADHEPARGSAAPTARRIAVTIPSTTHQFSSELLGAVEAGARAASYSLDVFTTDESEAQEREVVAAIGAVQVAGVVVIPVQGTDDAWGPLVAAGTPVVAVSREVAGLAVDLVAADNEAGAYAATRHLLTQGCRRVVQLEEDLAISTIGHRRRGFARAMAEVDGVTAETILVPTRRFEAVEPRWRATEAYGACRGLLASGRGFDGVVAGDDYFALGVLRALAEDGLRVPEDVRVIGYGDHPYAPWTSPSLSSVRVPARLIGEAAVSQLLQRVAGDDGDPVRRFIRTELVTRSSSVLHGGR